MSEKPHEGAEHPTPPNRNRPTEFDEARPWTRQPCDTNTRWASFLRYRDAVPPRSIRRQSIETGQAISTLQKWATDYGWPERAAAYDRHVDAARTAAVEDALCEDARAVASRHAAVLRDAQIAAASVVKGWLTKLANGDSLDGWTPNDVRGMLRDLIQLERLVRGEATERVEHSHGLDLTRLSVEEIETMRMIEVKAGVVD